MAIRYAVATGNWSNTATWNGGTLPTSSDDVYSNTFTVTIDTSPTVSSIRNTSVASPVVTAGGSFAIIANGITLNANVINGNVGCLAISLGSGFSCTINGTCTGGTANGGGVSNNGSGTVTINGGCVGGTASGAVALQNYSNGTVTINGNCIGGSGFIADGVRNNSVGIVNIFGDCYGGSNSSQGAKNTSIGIMNITGVCYGGSGAGSEGVTNTSSGTLNHIGIVQASSGAAGIGPGSATQITVLTGPFLTSAQGINPVTALRWFWANSTPPATYYQIRTQNLATIRPLYTADSVGGNPAASNVRSGTVFGPASELTGTAVIPSIYSVLTGVPVDNTVGSGPIDPAQFWNYPISGITTSGSIGERLKTAATVNVMGQLISDSFSAR